MDHALTTLDLIQIVLMVAACYACYWKGRFAGIEDVINELLDRDIINLKDLEDMEP